MPFLFGLKLGLYAAFPQLICLKCPDGFEHFSDIILKILPMHQNFKVAGIEGYKSV